MANGSRHSYTRSLTFGGSIPASTITSQVLHRAGNRFQSPTSSRPATPFLRQSEALPRDRPASNLTLKPCLVQANSTTSTFSLLRQRGALLRPAPPSMPSPASRRHSRFRKPCSTTGQLRNSPPIGSPATTAGQLLYTSFFQAGS